MNAALGLPSECGIVAAKGILRVDDLWRDMQGTSQSVLPHEARTALDALFDHIDALTAMLGVVNQEIVAWQKASETCQRLSTAPGVGPLTATALIAAVGLYDREEGPAQRANRRSPPAQSDMCRIEPAAAVSDAG